MEENDIEHGPHLTAIQPLIRAYEEYKNKYESWDGSQRDTHFITIAGAAQKNLPSNVLQEICGI